MKMNIALAALMLFGGVLGAQATEGSSKPTTSRTLVQFGGILTRGDDTGWGDLGYGLTFRSFTYLDPSSPDGWYFGFLSGALSHSAGGVALADTRLVTLGWRGNPLSGGGKARLDLQFDASLSPTLGARIAGTKVLGSAYTGVGLTLGIGIPVLEGQDLGLSWEPVFPITSWGGEPAPNRGYSDFVVSWTMKIRAETRPLAWD